MERRRVATAPRRLSWRAGPSFRGGGRSRQATCGPQSRADDTRRSTLVSAQCAATCAPLVRILRRVVYRAVAGARFRASGRLPRAVVASRRHPSTGAGRALLRRSRYRGNPVVRLPATREGPRAPRRRAPTDLLHPLGTLTG